MDGVSVGEVFLVRHGEAAGSDGSNPGLSEAGRAQTRLLSVRLAGRSVGGILHSPRRRAAETAALLSDALPGAPVRPSGCARRPDAGSLAWPPRRLSATVLAVAG
ncbi:MAG: histidine phosphatase family protein [Pseudonocardiales bacterium]|nr:histidine phosphatase family protein [Pseudonocardiales bacterium]